MPTFTLNSTPDGPLVRVALNVSIPHRNALQRAGRPIPASVLGNFLLDTGASETVVDAALVAPLGLRPTGSIPTLTPSTQGVPHMCDQYDVTLMLIHPDSKVIPLIVPSLPVLETSFRGHNIAGLIGRDVLSRCVFIHNGQAGQFTIAY